MNLIFDAFDVATAESLRLDRGNAAVQVRDLPVGARRGPLHADDELVGLTRGNLSKFGGQVLKFSVFPAWSVIAPNFRLLYGIGDDAGHDRPDEPDAHDDDNLAAFLAVLCNQLLEALEFLIVVFWFGEREGIAVGGL